MRLRGLVALILLPLLLAPGVGGASVTYECEMDGRIHRSRCCDHEGPGHEDTGTLPARGCCQVRASGESPTKPANPPSADEAPALNAPAVVAAVVSCAPQAPEMRAHPRAGSGPPIFLRNCTLLR